MQSIPTEQLRVYHGLLTNTDIWSRFALRADDIIVDTPPKCGTTWMLSIVMMLIHGRVTADAGNRDEAPWLDAGFRDPATIAAAQDALTRRRCMKSHSPMDGIAYGPDPSYVVVYRHPVDVLFSLQTHVSNMKEDFMDYMFEGDDRAVFQRFLDGPLTDAGTDDLTLASIAHHYSQASARRVNGNVHFFHYADLSRDLPEQIARLAQVLDISATDQLIDEIAQANTFANARRAAESSSMRFSDASPFRDQAEFYASGSSNKWKDRLSAEDMAACDARLATLMPETDAAWLNWGDRRAAP